ncbi:MAG TPA: PP2C family protein-serine/threonine phosphatase [Acidobacteriota bacterium]|nr:PP2C family protein-serine/threonine phosphatase [Acidobacteriota bacterium]
MSNREARSLNDAWPEPRQYRRSMRLEFSAYVSVLTLLLMTVTGYVITRQYVDTVTRNVVDKLLTQARSYSTTAGKHIIAGDQPDVLMLSNICKKLAGENADVYWSGITDKDGTFLVHTDVKRIMAGARLEVRDSERFGRLLRPDETFVIRGDTILVTIPISEQGIVLGRLGLASSGRQIGEARRASVTTVASITILMLIIGIPVTMVVVHRKLRPIGLIAASLKAVDFNDIAFDAPVHTHDECGYLAATLRVMGARLNRAQEELVEKERMDRELEIARDIQAKILPREFPGGPAYELAGSYRSAREVGGDYYDFVEFDDTHIGLLVADVSGKSLPGMLVMLMTRDIVKNLTRRLIAPAELLSQVNKELLPNLKKGMFVTMFFGVLNRRTGELVFASAGHNPLVWIAGAAGEPRLIKTKGFPLGMVPPRNFDARMEERRIQLQPNDWLIQYTDGINEAQDEKQNEFGMERFVGLLKSNRQRSAADLVQGTLADHQDFVGAAEQYDDMTILAMKWRGNGADMHKRRSSSVAHAS